MAIKTRSSSSKTKAAKADLLGTLRPWRGLRSNSRSPRSEHINAHLTELNLPSLTFAGELEELRKGGHDDVEHLGNIHLPTDMPFQATFTPDSPVGVKEGPTKTNPNDGTPPPIKHTHPTITINEATNLSPASEERTPAGSTST